MKRIRVTLLAVLSTCYSFAQVGIGTTSPNTTLDVRGSLAANSRSFSTTTETVLSTDYALLFTGSSACTLTLPDATGCIGRIIHIKNTKTGTVPVLTIATTASQTIDGQSTWLLDDPNESVNVVSNGTNWLIMGQTLPSGSGTSWTQGGNGVASLKTLGTTTNFDLPFITNNSERMRISSTGNVRIGTSAFDAANPEKLLVDAGTTSSFNVISGKGSIDNYLQLNIQNKSVTANASSDVVATADNGNESGNYVDLGINSSVYSNATYPILNGANNAYLYSTGNDFVIGNGTSNKNLSFFTGGYATNNERLRITGAGNIGINNTSPTEKLDVTGNIRFSGALMPNNSAGTSGYVLVSSGAGAPPTWQDATGYVIANAWSLGGNTLTGVKNFGTVSNHDLPFITNNTEKMRLTTGGFLGLGTNNPVARLHAVSENSEFGNDYVFDDYGSAVTQGFFIRKSRGTVGTPSNLQAGDHISFFRFSGRFNNTLNYTAGSGFDVYYQGDGTNDKTDLNFFTSGTQRMKISENGDVAIGATTFNASNPEQLIVDAGATGNSAFQNVIVGKGNTNSYAQLNIQNSNSGTSASSDVVATADNGTESVNYIDMGINSSTYTDATYPVISGINNAYLYSTGNDFVIGNATSNKNLILFTGGTATSNERMRITSGGNVGVATTSVNSTFEVNGSTGFAINTTTTNLTLGASYHTLIITGGTPTITLPAASSCSRRVYVLVNETGSNVNLSGSYIGFNAGASTIVPNNSSITIQSNGTSWYRIQ